jgi:hypothetical protein
MTGAKPVKPRSWRLRIDVCGVGLWPPDIGQKPPKGERLTSARSISMMISSSDRCAVTAMSAQAARRSGNF